MKIVIFADSLALPREEEAGNVPYENTYPYLLDQSLRELYGKRSPIVHERGERRRSIKDVLLDWQEQVDRRKADIVIIQVGIVDCAPRVFLPGERKIMSLVRPSELRETILNHVRKNRRRIISMRPNRVYVPIDLFEQCVDKIVYRGYKSGLHSLIFINIISPSDTLEYRSPGFQKNVNHYNLRLEQRVLGNKMVKLIDFNELIRQHGGTELLTVEGMHPNSTGHALLAQSLSDTIIKFIDTKI